ncbi:1554_t:CDS:2 [Diversispora eburnea]|uniref:1554_t:CDS:1 n=1 Tax=Diversispora eburnea TaxID=1213867 RepID=A0A9N9BEC6_9GLOM|nr:1554_t:CDS:2 [Diversispora eburnea]
MAAHHTELSPLDKGKILAYIENFNTIQIAKKIGCDPTTIHQFIDRYKKTGNTENLPYSGWPPALNNNEKNKLINETLYDTGIHFHVSAKKPFVSERHASACISWCEKYRDKKAYDWVQVIFSDVSSVEIGKQSQQIRVWRGVGEGLVSVGDIELGVQRNKRIIRVGDKATTNTRRTKNHHGNDKNKNKSSKNDNQDGDLHTLEE